jgi:hypothetical protein
MFVMAYIHGPHNYVYMLHVLYTKNSGCLQMEKLIEQKVFDKIRPWQPNQPKLPFRNLVDDICILLWPILRTGRQEEQCQNHVAQNVKLERKMYGGVDYTCVLDVQFGCAANSLLQ